MSRSPLTLNALRSLFFRPSVTSKTSNFRSFSISNGDDEVSEIIYRSELPDLQLPEQDAASLILSRAAGWMQKDAIECSVTGRKYTYGGLVDGALKWGAALLRIVGGVEPPFTVMTFLPNCPEYPIVTLGAHAVGATITTISPAYSQEEIKRQLVDSEPIVAVVDPQLEAVLTAAVSDLKMSIKVVVNGVSARGNPNLQELLQDTRAPFADPVQVPLSRTAFLLYSSGTTGKPKGAALSHGAFSSNLAIFTHEKNSTFQPTTAATQDTVLGLMPFYHLYGIFVVSMNALYRGLKIISMPKFTPESFIATIRDHKVNPLHLVPPTLNFLAMSPLVTSADLVHVKAALIGGAPVPPTMAKAFKKKVSYQNIFFQEGFGTTETMVTHMTPVDAEVVGFCGKILPNVTAKLVDTETGVSVGPGQPGELCIKSPSLMSEYHKNPEATAATIDPKGWLHTGDIATVNEEGFFKIVDRIKELIKVKGFQVSPSELEEILLQHPGVSDVGVVGVKDERAGELPRAYVVVSKSGQEKLTEEDLHTFLKDRVAPHKRLAGGVRFVDQLPKNQTGKLLRRQLNQMAEKEG